MNVSDICRVWVRDVTTPITQTSTASGSISQMWNLETTSSRFVLYAIFLMFFSLLQIQQIVFLLLWYIADIFYVHFVTTGQCKSVLPGPRKRLQQQCCALWRSIHRQLRLRDRMSPVLVSVTCAVRNSLLVFPSFILIVFISFMFRSRY